MTSNWLTLHAVASELGISYNKLYSLVQAGDIPVVRLPGRRKCYSIHRSVVNAMREGLPMPRAQDIPPYPKPRPPKRFFFDNSIDEV